MARCLNIDWLVGDSIGVLNGRNPVESPAVLQQLEREGHVQLVTVRPWPFTMAWRVPGSNLRNFMVRASASSGLSQWDMFRLNEFCVYEMVHGRRVPIWFEDTSVRDMVVASIIGFFAEGLADLPSFLVRAMASQRERFTRLPPEPSRLSDCRYCHDGLCCGDLVCHTTTVQSAIAIIQSGRILSACRTFGVSPEEIAGDSRNAAGDPPDYFDYVMFGPGNCTAVDKLVYERTVEHVPSWEEFEAGFQPGVRFFFRSKDLRALPRWTHDGIHEKIGEQLSPDSWLVVVVVPEGLPGSEELLQTALQRLPCTKVKSMPFVGTHYRDWAAMAYREAKDAGSG